MKTYVNNGSKDGKKGYLVVGGKRVYTGQEFEASDKDIKALEKGYNVSLKTVAPTKPKTVEKPKNVEKTSEAEQSKKPERKKSKSFDDFTKKSKTSSYSGFDYKSTKPDKGVK